ncbi:MAG: T9SS type A sorting domain-containing protein, partial [Flavobacteriales bacterium]|nr:T9SS type A sorting domain-containing protein [Flavobacteriales bacterium]
EISFGSGISVYPNPSNANITVQLRDVKGVDVSIINTLGEKVYVQNNVSQEKVEISVINLRNGIYFIIVRGEIDQKVIKLVKQ